MLVIMSGSGSSADMVPPNTNGIPIITREHATLGDSTLSVPGSHAELNYDPEIIRLAERAHAAFPEIPKTELGGAVKFADVWVQHQPERYTSGKAYLYFWPSGLTEEASIHLAQSDDVYSLVVSPLTGRVKVSGTRVDAPGQVR